MTTVHKSHYESKPSSSSDRASCVLESIRLCSHPFTGGHSPTPYAAISSASARPAAITQPTRSSHCLTAGMANMLSRQVDGRYAYHDPSSSSGAYSGKETVSGRAHGCPPVQKKGGDRSTRCVSLDIMKLRLLKNARTCCDSRISSEEWTTPCHKPKEVPCLPG